MKEHLNCLIAKSEDLPPTGSGIVAQYSIHGIILQAQYTVETGYNAVRCDIWLYIRFMTQTFKANGGPCLVT